jgi:hypothetical protein
VCGLQWRGRKADGLDEHVAHSDQRTVVETRIFGQFSGQIPAQSDTRKRRGDTKDRCGRKARGTEKKCDGDGRGHARGDRDLIDGRKRTPLSDVIERTRTKRNRSARPTRIGGFAKGARFEKSKKRRLSSSLQKTLVLLR